MACERFRDALADVAAGEPAPAAVEAHLASCEACRAEVVALQRALALADAEMAGLAGAEPTPDLAARIRRALAESGTSGSAFEAWPSPAWRFGWLWPAVAVAAALLVAFAVGMGRGTAPVPEPRVAVDDRPSPTARPRPADSVPPPVIPRDVDRQGPETSAVPARQARGAADASPPRLTGAPPGDRAIPGEPEVLVPPGEKETLLQFIALVHRERHMPAALLAAGSPSADLAEPAALVIKPLEIVPLDPAEAPGT